MLACSHPQWDGEREKEEAKPKKFIEQDKNCSVTKRDLEEEEKIMKVMGRQSLTTPLAWNNAHVPKTGKANPPKSPPPHYHC